MKNPKAQSSETGTGVWDAERWICDRCAVQRCYRWPGAGAVASRIGQCDYCGSLGPTWLVDDLLPGWEDDVSEV